MTQTNRRWRPTVALFVGTSVVSLVLYALTASPGVLWGDTAELQRVAYTLDLPHPTGYPFYLLLGRLWITLWPFGTVAAKMNFLSGVFAALTVGVVCVLVYRVTERASAAAFGSMVLAVTPSFWSQAVVAEVYSLHTLLVACTLLALLWDRPLRPVVLPLATFLVGLGLAHHRMGLLLIPGIAVYLLSERAHGGLTLRRVAVPLATFLLGLSPYLLTYLRGDWPSLRTFLAYVLHSGGQWFAWESMPEYLAGIVWPLLRQQMGVLGLLLAMVGLAYSARRSKPRPYSIVLLLGISWAVGLLFLAIYRVGDIYAFFPHFQTINAILVGLGLAELLLWIERLLASGRMRSLEGTASWVLTAAVVILLGWNSWAANDYSQERYIAERSLEVLGLVPSDALLVASWPEGQPLRYQQEVEGWRSDLEIVVDDAPTVDKVQALLESGEPVAFWGSKWLDVVGREAHAVAPLDPLLSRRDVVLVTPGGFGVGDGSSQHELGQEVAPGLSLERYQIEPRPLETDGVAGLTLCWAGDTAKLQDYVFILRVDPEHDWLEHPFTVGDRLGPSGCGTTYLVLPPAPFVGSADAELRILRKEHPDPEAEIAFESLALVAGDDVSVERLMLEEVLPTGLFASGAELIGATNDPLTSPGISFPVDVYWRISPGDGRSSPVTLELRDEGGTVVDRQADDFQAPLLADLESPGGVYAARYWLSMPRRAEPGLYGIYLGAGDQPALVEASSIEVEEPVRIWRAPDMAHPTGDEFADGRISLAGYDLVVADGAIDLTLYWKSLEAVDGNWKVFVHLLGPDGAIAAQSDSFPGGGLRWTDTWKPREYVIDPHTMNPPDPLDGGGYTVLVGMYDPETGVRVPVATDPDGRLSDAIHLTVTAP